GPGGVLGGRQQRVVVRGDRVGGVPGAVARHHDRGHLAAAGAVGVAGAGVTAAGVVVALVMGHDDGVVALRPEGGVGDLAHGVAEVGVTLGHQPLVLGIRRREVPAVGVPRVDAEGRVAVLVGALGRDDVAEGRDVAAGEVPVELVDGHLAVPVRRV